jgi:hypothetical protein
MNVIDAKAFSSASAAVQVSDVVPDVMQLPGAGPVAGVATCSGPAIPCRTIMSSAMNNMDTTGPPGACDGAVGKDVQVLAVAVAEPGTSETAVVAPSVAATATPLEAAATRVTA